MDFIHSIFITGFLIGFGVAFPIGPIATLMIRQTISYGLLSGLSAALAVIIADGFYAWVAAILASFIEGWMHNYSRWFYLLGGAFLMYIGIQILMSHIKYNNGSKKALKSPLSSFLHTLFLTLASPMTTLLFIGWFNTTGIFKKIENAADIGVVVLGVLAGATVWYVFLVTVVATVKKKYDLKIFRYVNLIAGSAIIAFSLIIIGQAILGIK